MLVRITIFVLAFLLAGPRLEASSEKLSERSENTEVVAPEIVQSEVVKIACEKKKSNRKLSTYIPVKGILVRFSNRVHSDLIVFIRRIQI